MYVARTMDVRALLASIQPLWLLGAALCVPLSESVDRADLLRYGPLGGLSRQVGGLL